jgi:ABC-2 type transport system ATP-binding protein
MADTALLLAHGLSRSYGRHAAVSDFTAAVHAGEVVVLVGPNGCGKTTSVEMVLGLRRSDGGTARVLGLDPRRDRREVARSVGVQLQGAALHSRVRLREQLEYVGALYGTGDRWRDVAATLGLTSSLDRFYGTLSGGLQRRALVATALAGEPRLAVLDEPTSGVDVESRLELWSAVRTLLAARDAGTLVTTHDLTEAEQHADRVLVMRSGRVVADGSPAELVRRSGLASVLTLRRPAGTAGWVLPAHDGRPLATSPVEVTIGFGRPAGAQAFRAAVEGAGGPAGAGTVPRVIERVPTLQDAYLALAAGDPR